MNINCLCRSVVLVCLLASCQKNEVADVNVAVTNSAPVVATPAVTKDDWNKALSSSAKPFGPEKKEDGLRFYSACFGPVANNKCIEPHLYEYEAEYDSFKRVYFFNNRMEGICSGAERLNLRQNKRGAALSDVYSYISLPDSERPFLFISPRYVGKSARFSMNSVAILSDDVVVFEKKFSFLDVATNLDSSLIGAHDLVDQSISLHASEEEVSSLSNITPKSVVAIRIYDDSGYIVLEKNITACFVNGLINNISALRKLKNSLPVVSNISTTAKQ